MTSEMKFTHPTQSLILSKTAIHKEFDKIAATKYGEVMSHARASYQQAHRFSNRHSSVGFRRESANRHVIIDQPPQPDYINALHSRVALGRKGVDEQVSDLSLFGAPKKEITIYNAAVQSYIPHSKTRIPKHKQKAMSRKEEESYVQTLPVFQRYDYLARKLHFNIQEILNLQKMFTTLANVPPRPGYMNRSLFTDFCRTTFDITDDIMLDQMFHYFDADQEGFISFTEWIQILSVFLRGTFEEQIKYCFNIYDLDFNGTVERKEIMTLVYDCLTDTMLGLDYDIHEQVREIVELLMKKLDISKTGTVRLEHFREAVRKDSSLLQCLGKCLPDQERIISFLGMFTDEIGNYRTNYCLAAVANAGFQYDTQPRLLSKLVGRPEQQLRKQRSRRSRTYREHTFLPLYPANDRYKAINSVLLDKPLLLPV